MNEMGGTEPSDDPSGWPVGAMTFCPYCLHISGKMPNIAFNFGYALPARRRENGKHRSRHRDLPDGREYGCAGAEVLLNIPIIKVCLPMRDA